MGKLLHASYSGYFPYCILPYNDSEFFPFRSVSILEDAMRLFWRIKKIRFYGTYEPTNSPGETRDWQMVAVSAASEEKNLVCNPGWLITEQENLVNQGTGSPFNSTFNFEEVTSFLGGYVVRLSFGGFFQDTLGPAGWAFENPSQTESQGTLDFEGVTMWGGVGLEGATFDYEIQEYWSYGGTWNTITGQLL